MNELTRFFQTRSVQKLSEESKRQVGLPVYPASALSKFTLSLIESHCNKKQLLELIAMYRKNEPALTALPNILLQLLYDWADMKAKPLRIRDLGAFIDELNANEQLKDASLPDQSVWQQVADAYVAELILPGGTALDLDLAMRCLYILSILIETGEKFSLAQGSQRLLDQLMGQPLMLPDRLFNSRCCKTKGDRELPGGRLVQTVDVQAKAYDGPPLEQPDPCECTCDETCRPPSRECICIKPYVADLLVVREELVRYEEGDIAYIENILAGEHKRRTHRSLYRTEDYSEEENETNISEEKDLQVTEKFSLQSEVQKTINTDLSLDAGVSYSQKFGKAMDINAHANVAASYSKTKSEATARSYARDVIDRSVSKIDEKIRTLESRKVIHELEETNKHGLNNVGGDHRAGIYYWVNKITKAQLFNYGKRMMIDVYVPEPAALYKKLYLLKNENRTPATIPPTKPTITADEITRGNYTDKLLEFDVAEGEAPPDKVVSLQLGFEYNVSEPDNNSTMGFSQSFKSEKVPEGYLAKEIDYAISCAAGHYKNTDSGLGDEKDEVAVLVHIADQNVFNKNFNQRTDSGSNKEWSASGKVTLSESNRISGVVSYAVSGYSTVGVAVAGSATIKCELSAEAYQSWQVKMFNLIMEGYIRKLEAYELAKAQDEELVQIKGRNPFLNREVERNELKRHVIAILMCNYFNGLGSMMERVAPCGYPEIDFGKLEKDTPYIRFFEQVFEWQHVLYLFYHSMWARKCKWPELMDEDSGDPLFDKFLMAGASRVQVPVREGMEEVFAYFLATGKIWGESGIPPIYGEDEYVSIIQEIVEARQGDYSQREGEVSATKDDTIITLSDSTYYWDEVNGQLNQLSIDNDIDREILLDMKIYRIQSIEQTDPTDISTWTITLSSAFEGDTSTGLKHAVGARFVGAPWEVRIPTKLVYLQNETDKLPTYPLEA